HAVPSLPVAVESITTTPGSSDPIGHSVDAVWEPQEGVTAIIRTTFFDDCSRRLLTLEIVMLPGRPLSPTFAAGGRSNTTATPTPAPADVAPASSAPSKTNRNAVCTRTPPSGPLICIFIWL